MSGKLLLLCWFYGSVFAVGGSTSNSLKFTSLKVHPEYQVINEYEDVVIDCIERDNGKVHWDRQQGLHLPKQAIQKGGRLSIYNISYEDGGDYVCFNENKTLSAQAFVQVFKKTTTTAFTTSSFYKETTLGLPSTKRFFNPVTELASTPYPCLYGTCNGTCCRSDSVEAFFDCANGQKINKALVCNRENDCDDGSDESRCSPWPPKITVLPKHKVEIYCGDQDKKKSGILILECESVGNPVPLIRWKKYEGHVPSKCQQYSKRGHGILTCPDFQQSDQGAYSCVAENLVKSAESQPKSLAKCSNSINCKGFRVVNEEQIEHCVECYCSGKTTQCQNIKSNLTVNKFPFPESKTELFASDDGEILFIPTKTAVIPSSEVRKSAQEIIYCALFENDLKEISFLKSFGRSIIIPRFNGKTSFLAKAPDLILQGNNVSLMYTSNLLSSSRSNVLDVSVRFWPGNWHHLNKRPAGRADLMKVLSRVDSLFIRCEYQKGQTVNWNKTATIFLESSVITDSTNSVSYVEKCNCPSGYEGLSCETCAAGYEKKADGNDFVCKKIYVPAPLCNTGFTGVNCSSCDTSKGYYKRGNTCSKPVCHPDGSVDIFPDSSGKCKCKERVTGHTCDRCTNDSFYLHKAKGCLKCWCNGVTNQCKSSSLHRTVISNIPRGGYNSSDGRNFWLLPSDFSGNRLTSYGGYLNYTIKYRPDVPNENASLTVEILSVDDVTLIYTNNKAEKSLTKHEKSWVVFLTETNWKLSDASGVTRDEFLTVLTKIKAIYIESPYHLSSGKANLSSALMNSAGLAGSDKSDLALEVEECSCPKGYTGLSCESCSEGYYKKRNGIFIQCIKCNCSYCDPDYGCPDCPQLTYRDNPEEEKIPICKPCPCNGNGISCIKDDHNQIFCRCKSDFTGMHCENSVQKGKDELTISISPRTVKAKKVGAVVYFNCSLLSNEEMILSAEKSYGGARKDLVKSTYNDSKKITNKGTVISKNFQVVLEAELKAVECFVHDTQGRLAGHVVAVVEDMITVTEPVQIINCYSDRIDLKESESRDIICEATGSPTPVVNWYRTINGLEVKKVDTSEGVHTIESVSLGENGTIYTCVAENSEGDKTMCTKVLIVRKKCEVINIFPKYVIVEEGKNISIQCKTTANSSVVWSIVNTVTGKQKPTFSNRVKVDTHTGFLYITNSKVSDSGTYICTAKGENGEINKTVTVTVEEERIPPVASILEYDKTLKVGETFKINCEATGKPAPAISWTKLNGSFERNILVTGNTLTIERALVNNSGIYGCQALSVSGNASSYISIEVQEIFYPPKINISEDIKVHEGDEVTVTCLALGYPRPKISWFAPKIEMMNILRKSDSKVRNEPLLLVKEEIIFNVSKDMNGMNITCLGENIAGTSQQTAQIKILQSKSGINETIEFVPIGSYIELNCDFAEDIVWDKLGGLVGDECLIPNGLMIPSVQNQHNGTYVCKMHSEIKKIIRLMVVGFVPKFSRLSRSYLVLPVHLNSSYELCIEMSFNPKNEEGVLLHKENNKLKIYLKKKNIHLSIFSNDEDLLDIAMSKPIQLGSWYTLAVLIRINYVDITVYDENTLIHERKTERTQDFNISMGLGLDSFFIGGPIIRRRHLPQMFSGHYSHFDGCISRLKIDQHEFDIVKEGSFSHNVTLCRRCLEEPNPCQENGKCLDAPTQYGFICVCSNDFEEKKATCPKSCTGKGCETQLDLCTLLNPCSKGFLHRCINEMYNLQCLCAFGYSGTTCEKLPEYSFCAKGNGFVKLPSDRLERFLGVPEVIKMSFTLIKPDGQLLWQGNKFNHLSISVLKGKLKYVYLNQNSKLEINGATELELNKKYMLLMRRINSSAILELTQSAQSLKPPVVYRNFTDNIKTNRVVGDIYLGIVPNSVFHQTLYNNHQVGLYGCIHFVAFGEKPKINLLEKKIERVNIFLVQKLRHSYYDSDKSYSNSIDLDYE